MKPNDILTHLGPALYVNLATKGRLMDIPWDLLEPEQCADVVSGILASNCEFLGKMSWDIVRPGTVQNIVKAVWACEKQEAFAQLLPSTWTRRIWSNLSWPLHHARHWTPLKL
jgi:hypothetical protein